MKCFALFQTIFCFKDDSEEHVKKKNCAQTKKGETQAWICRVAESFAQDHAASELNTVQVKSAHLHSTRLPCQEDCV